MKCITATVKSNPVENIQGFGMYCASLKRQGKKAPTQHCYFEKRVCGCVRRMVSMSFNTGKSKGSYLWCELTSKDVPFCERARHLQRAPIRGDGACISGPLLRTRPQWKKILSAYYFQRFLGCCCQELSRLFLGYWCPLCKDALNMSKCP